MHDRVLERCDVVPRDQVPIRVPDHEVLDRWMVTGDPHRQVAHCTEESAVRIVDRLSRLDGQAQHRNRVSHARDAGRGRIRPVTLSHDFRRACLGGG